jgi:hypothetical protein
VTQVKVGRGLCIYCQQRPADSDEHVPSKGLFRKPYPPNLWTVPACRECNNSFAKDEEYFRLLLVGLFCFSDEAEELFGGPISRSLDRRRHLEELMFNALGVDGEKPFVTWDQDRVCRVVKKIVDGLYFREFGRTVRRRSVYEMHFVHHEDARLSATLAAAPVRDAMAPDFAYRVASVPEHGATLWQLTFYDVHWLCAVLEPAGT